MDIRRVLSLQSMGMLSTVLLKTQDGGQFRVERLMLMASSRYFRTLFVTDLHKGAARREITIPGVSASVLQDIIHYAQTEEVKLTMDNVGQLMADADQFEVQSLVNKCSSYLTLHLTSTNCIGIYNFAQAYFFQDLASKVHAFIMRKFPAVAKNSEELLDLTPTEVIAILASDELHVRDERILQTFVNKYIHHDRENRVSFQPALMGQIRLGLTKKLAGPRLPHEVLLCIGGWISNSASNKIEAFDVRKDLWVEVPDMDDPLGSRAYHGCASIAQNIYIFGGFDGINDLNSSRCLNLLTKEWQERSPMNRRRRFVSTVTMDGAIYALGGHDGRRHLRSCEWYNPTTNQWTLLPEMSRARSNAGTAVLGGQIYVVGGFDGEDYLNTCEKLDPKTGVWSKVARMGSPRCGLSCAVYGGHLYAVGGFNGDLKLTTVERYGPDDNKWSRVACMHNCRSNFAISVLDDRLFVMGGVNNGVINRAMADVECYDRKRNVWLDATKMVYKKSGCSACVVNSKLLLHPKRVDENITCID